MVRHLDSPTGAGPAQRHQTNSSSSSSRSSSSSAVAAPQPQPQQQQQRRRWRLRRQRCGIATVVDKISTEYEITQQQRTRSHCRERRSAGSLAPTLEVARTRHASPASLWCLRINVGLCLPLPSTAHSDQCLLCAAVWVVASCPLIVVPLCLVLVGQSYDVVVIDGSSL